MAERPIHLAYDHAIGSIDPRGLFSQVSAMPNLTDFRCD
jgi:hypothetical protein